ncbi:hypothetical protein ACJX0J_038155 [Zea mays]
MAGGPDVAGLIEDDAVSVITEGLKRRMITHALDISSICCFFLKVFFSVFYFQQKVLFWRWCNTMLWAISHIEASPKKNHNDISTSL